MAKIVDDDQWLEARLELLQKEKELTRLRDEVSASRRNLPWRLVTEDYEFTGADGVTPLRSLFNGQHQLIVYHFMFGEGWEEGCKSCSFWADQYDGIRPHLRARNVEIAAVSRAPWQDFQSFKNRMGWQFPWFSSHGSSFNLDFRVSFDSDTGNYNYRDTSVQNELPGLSVFHLADDGQIFHTYSCYGRGLDSLSATYQMLDLVPDGRNESDLPFPMAWVKLHDEYDSTS